jgi:hypothetical protein
MRKIDPCRFVPNAFLVTFESLERDIVLITGFTAWKDSVIEFPFSRSPNIL